jgi:adenylate cyclase
VAATRRLAAIVFTDVAGYTSFAQSDEAGALRLLQEQDRLIRPLLEAHRGRKVKSMGDGLLIEFHNVLDAIEYAVDLQRHVNERNTREGERPLRLRVGIHLGDVQRKGTDILGDAVNIASRVEPLADPGGVCLSEPVYVQVHNKVPYRLEKLGPKSLKGVQEPMNIYRVVLPWTVGEPSSTNSAHTGLAVLPFSNISPDPKDEYFADGLTEELITVLSQLRGLRVIARTSVMQYKSTTKSVPQIGGELRVSSILEGSVRKAGNRLRVTAQLIDVGSEGHVWANTYDRDLDDIFAVQSEIAAKVASSLKVQLLEKDMDRIEKRSGSSVEAYTLLLKGRFHLQRWAPESFRTAIKYFEEAIAHDPNYAAAYAGLAEAHATLGFMEVVDLNEAYPKAEEYARRALKLDESLAEAHLSLAIALLNRYDFAGRDKELTRALELNPNLAHAHLLRSEDFAFRRMWDDSLREVEKALELDPLSARTEGWAGTRYLYAGQYDKAIQHLKNAVELDPKNSAALSNLGLAHIQKGMIQEGLEEVKRAAEGSSSPCYPDLAYAYVKAGKPEEARGLLPKLFQSSEGGRAHPVAIGGVYAALGEKEKALEWLERAFEDRRAYLVSIRDDFVFESVRGDPRFQSLLQKMNLA